MSCAFTGCSDPSCGPCTASARFPKLAACGKAIKGEKNACGLVAGHDARVHCRPGRDGNVERADLKESEPVVPITNEQAATALAYKKRKREGPVRQQRA
jgi:hypothetical protein